MLGTMTGTATRYVTLSEEGSDRATAYPMSAKLVAWDGRWLATWLDRHRQNQWAVIDPAEASVTAAGPIGPIRRDNHCGSALAASPDGAAHLLIGGHHDEFFHFHASAGVEPTWQQVGIAAPTGATYPSLASAPDGMLHLTYRCRGLLGKDQPYPYHVMYARWNAADGWSAPRPLVRVATLDHTWTMHGLTVDAAGGLHVVMTATLPQGERDKYYGAIHLTSRDAGASWLDDDGVAIAGPGLAASLPRIEGRGLDPSRIERQATPPLPCGPHNSYYHQMVPSNPVATRRGLVVLVHDQLGAAIDAWRRDAGGWSRFATLPTAGDGRRWSGFSTLAERVDGTLEAVATVAPAHGFGADGSTLRRVVMDADGRVLDQHDVLPADPSRACWLPSLERGPLLRGHPALLATVGRNAASGLAHANNFNDGSNRVVLVLPQA